MSGHDEVHVGLQKHSLGGSYPLTVVGYDNGDGVRYVVENLVDGTVLCSDNPTPIPYQSREAHIVRYLITPYTYHPLFDKWIKGRPHFDVTGSLAM